MGACALTSVAAAHRHLAAVVVIELAGVTGVVEWQLADHSRHGSSVTSAGAVVLDQHSVDCREVLIIPPAAGGSGRPR